MNPHFLFMLAVMAAVTAAATTAPAQQRPPSDEQAAVPTASRNDRPRRSGREDRRAARFRSWDKNGDGVLVEEEVPAAYLAAVRSAAKRLGVKSSEGVAIDALLGRRADPPEDGSQGKKREKKQRKQSGDAQTSNLRGFGETAERKPPRGFEPVSSPDKSPAKAKSEASGRADGRSRRYARGLLKRYDTNQNGVLERDEWQKIRGAPAKSDANGDGVLTVDEMANRYALVSKSRSSKSPPDKREPSQESKEPSKKTSTASTKKEGQKGRASYRFTPGLDRVPEKVRKWFKRKDTDQDGQIAMHEYASSWSDNRVREFNRYDKNGDGFITPVEYQSR